MLSELKNCKIQKRSFTRKVKSTKPIDGKASKKTIVQVDMRYDCDPGGEPPAKRDDIPKWKVDKKNKRSKDAQPAGAKQLKSLASG